MSSSSKKRVALVVLETGGCGIFSPGDRMVIEGKEVLKGSSNRICCEAIVSLYPSLRDLTGKADLEAGGERVELRCAGEGCTARFA
ncbi:MAG: hypothetical protein N3A38_08495, partial [Planctomycetota bacterium]|nr:hypothetical protein [Planctomycetota bacterium]